MIRTFQIALFGVMVLAQLAVPTWMIGGHEWSMRNGTAYKFLTAPIDPYDAFRGKYVALAFESNHAPVDKGVQLSAGETVYVTVETGPTGYARLSNASTFPPNGTNYITTRVLHEIPRDAADNADNEVAVDLPFDRYYMDENLAPLAEQAYRANSTQATRNCYATVRVYKGKAVIEELFIEDMPVADFLAQHQEFGP
ncbi:MAG: GDYXXLXY domain-containing protein [Candidatus Hydrogenedentales bacterium]|jgi:uncharacterized membrane-anchored protein